MTLVFPGVKVSFCIRLPDESREHRYRVRTGSTVIFDKYRRYPKQGLYCLTLGLCGEDC